MSTGHDPLLDPDPAADQAATVVADSVRITVLTERLIRIEHADDGRFEDRGTTAVVNRRVPVPDFHAERGERTLSIRTSALQLHVADTTAPLSAATLSAVIGSGRRRIEWRYGDRPTSNLGGTTRTLDNCRGRLTRDLVDLDENGDLVYGDWTEWDLDPGLLSRDGWVVVDDSGSPVMNTAASVGTGRGGRSRKPPGRPSRQGWPVERPQGVRQDLYLLAHGDDHKAALADAARLFGPQPLPPRYVFGYWYSRYHPFTDRELLSMADQFDQMGVPLDVMVVDMDWHLPGWTGYTWDERYFPDPSATIDDLHRRGLRVSLNLHPADGVGPHEQAFVAMCADLGLDPESTERIPFDVTDPAFIDAYLRHLHHPHEDIGVDFWWMDWQQGTDTGVEGLDPLPWLNELHWEDQLRRRPSQRPLDFSRWGGLGGGRYPIGFSGDTWSEWPSLALQPWFTATAANVLYGYWSHDIGGHYGDAPSPELYARWVQFGAHSPIMRTHSTKDPGQERRLWEFPDPYRSAMIDAVRRRYELVPYVYGAARKGFESGESMIRPMYHDHPGVEGAYDAAEQYLLGESLIVAPVVQAAAEDRMAAASTWLPKGSWYDTALGAPVRSRFAGGTLHSDRYLISETPVFAAAGSIISGQLDAKRLNTPYYPHLLFSTYPGDDGDTVLYEDDGVSQGYLSGASVEVPVSHVDGGERRTLSIGPAEGSYRGWKRTRDVRVRFVGEAPPGEVTLKVASERRATSIDWVPGPDRAPANSPSWWYDAATATVEVRLPGIELTTITEVRLDRDPALPGSVAKVLDGSAGLARRLDVIAALASDASNGYELHPEERLPIDLAQAANRISRSPDRFVVEWRRVRRNLGHLVEVLDAFALAWEGAVALVDNRVRQPAIDSLEEANRIARSTTERFG